MITLEETTEVALHQGAPVRLVLERAVDDVLGSNFWLAARVDVDAGADGWVAAWVEDLDTGKILWNVTPAPVAVDGRVGTVARLVFPLEIAEGNRDDPRLSLNLGSWTDGRDQEIREGKATFRVPPARAADRTAWQNRVRQGRR